MGGGASVQQQSSEQVGDMIASLGDAYIPYKKIIVENGVNGEFICSLSNESEMSEMFQSLGITNFVHKKNITNLFKKNDGGTANIAASSSTNSKSEESQFKIVDRLTISPNAIMKQICKIQGIELDPKNIDIGCNKIKSVVELNAAQPVEISGSSFNYNILVIISLCLTDEGAITLKLG